MHFFWKKTLQTLENITAQSRKTLEDVLIVFRRKYVKPGSQATDKHKWHKLTFDPTTKSLTDFLRVLNEYAERAFGANANLMIDNLLYAKLPLHLRRPINSAYLDHGTYDQTVAHPERELELRALENDGKLSVPTPTAIHCYDNLKKIKNPRLCAIIVKKVATSLKIAVKRWKRNKTTTDFSTQNTKPSSSKTYAPCPQCQRTNHSPEKCWKSLNAADRP